jgi:hypothetical protein
VVNGEKAKVIKMFRNIDSRGGGGFADDFSHFRQVAEALLGVMG